MSRFFVLPEDVKSDRICISGKESHHIVDVMRLKLGDEVTAFDGTGREYRGTIIEIGNKRVVVGIDKVKEKEDTSGIEVTLAQAIPKKAKMDDIVQKATELGVTTIIPMITERTIVMLNEVKGIARRRRWEEIGRASAKQCGRVNIPVIEQVLKFSEVIEKSKKYDLALIPSLLSGSIPLKEVLSDFKGKRIMVLIGPEGDFTPREVAKAKDTGCWPVSLGKNVLRCDTAAIVTVGILSSFIRE